MASRAAQKGVIGIKHPPSDLPFCPNGCTAGLIMNSHGVPSRMTMGHSLEGIATLVAVTIGNVVDATAFTGAKVHELGDVLEQHGKCRFGTQRLFSGKTGVPFRDPICFTPQFYQVLRHQVVDKLHARRKGPTTVLAHQPLESRGNNGGLRFGEMEWWALLAQCVPAVLLDRLMECSDIALVPVCSKCGRIACQSKNSTTSHLEVRAKNKYCIPCESGDNVHDVQMPAAMRLFIQELEAMHIVIRLELEGDHVEVPEGGPLFEPYGFDGK